MSEPREVCEDRERRWLEAVEWHALRCGPTAVTLTQQAAWRRWWQDWENRRIYGACARLHVDAQQLPLRTSSARADRAQRAPSATRVHRTAPRRLLLGTVALGAAIACAVLVLKPDGHVLPVRAEAALGPPTLYRTGSGQTRRIHLSDGSTVVLGAETALTVTLTRRRRSVTLAHGEAWFNVTHRPRWPFVVSAGAGTITDLGTAFVVDREAHRVEVTVTEGRVEIALAHAHDISAPRLQGVRLEPVRLRRGERLSYGANALGTVRTVDPRMALAWTNGELEFSDEPLRDVAANVSRYAPQPIAVSPAAGELRVTTLVFSHDVPQWLNGLSRALPVTVTQSDVGICVRLRTHPKTPPDNTCPKR